MSAATDRSFSPTAPSVVASPEPPPKPLLTIAVIGDWGAGSPAQAAIASKMCELRKSDRFDEVITTGDNFYSPDGKATTQNFDGPLRCLIDAGIKWRAAWGNHDLAGDSTAKRLGSASHYFTWEEAGVAFFVVDSNATRNATQQEWLDSHLRAASDKRKVVIFHHPAFTVGLHENNMGVQARWVPMFEKYGVDLVLNGHNHD